MNIVKELMLVLRVVGAGFVTFLFSLVNDASFVHLVTVMALVTVLSIRFQYGIHRIFNDVITEPEKRAQYLDNRYFLFYTLMGLAFIGIPTADDLYKFESVETYEVYASSLSMLLIGFGSAALGVTCACRAYKMHGCLK